MEIRMGDSKMEGAYEITEILISDPSIVEKWLDDAEELPHTLMHTIAGWYMHAPRPSVEDIASCHLSLQGPWHVLTLKIRRGKDMLAQYLNMHYSPMTRNYDDGVELTCGRCGERMQLPWDSFGHLGGNLVRQVVGPCNAKEAVSTGPVQRAVDSGDSNREPQSRA